MRSIKLDLEKDRARRAWYTSPDIQRTPEDTRIVGVHGDMVRQYALANGIWLGARKIPVKWREPVDYDPVGDDYRLFLTADEVRASKPWAKKEWEINFINRLMPRLAKHIVKTGLPDLDLAGAKLWYQTEMDLIRWEWPWHKRGYATLFALRGGEELNLGKWSHAYYPPGIPYGDGNKAERKAYYDSVLRCCDNLPQNCVCHVT